MPQEDVTPESPLELAKRALEHVQKTKAWALVKVNAMEERIAAVGGEPSAELKQAIEEVRAAAQ